MSTKSHLYLNRDSSVEVFEETLESQEDENGKHLGFDIYFYIDLKHLIEVKQNISAVQIRHRITEVGVPSVLKFNVDDVIETEFDNHGVTIHIEGGTETAKAFKADIQKWEGGL